MSTSRTRRRRIYKKAASIARDIRTADFPDAVRIVAGLIGSRDHHKRRRRATQTEVQPSTDVVMVEGKVPVSEPIARELIREGILVAGDKGPEIAIKLVSISDADAAFIESRQFSICTGPECLQFRESWPGCCKLNVDTVRARRDITNDLREKGYIR